MQDVGTPTKIQSCISQTEIESKNESRIQKSEAKVKEKSTHSLEHIVRERDLCNSKVKERVEKLISLVLSGGERVSLDDINWDNLSQQEQIEILDSWIKEAYPVLSPELRQYMSGTFYYGDCGRSPDERPDWLDMDKFQRGQKFALDHFFGINYAQLLSLFTLFSFDHGLKPLILTDKSSAPYTSFKRYLSTGSRVRNWYMENPWEPGTAAYKDIVAVRKMHAAVRSRLMNMTRVDFEKAVKIKNPMCPTREMLLDDLQATCPAPAPGQCPYMAMFQNPDYENLGLNQAEMSLTQFGFFGLVLLYPNAFGIHNASEEDFEDFCHTWRGLGYLLGIEDKYNFCNGTMEEIRQRCRDYLYLWVKPNFREITPEWEHMMRCVIEGLNYYHPSSNYEVSFLYLAELMDLHMPRLYNSLSYVNWIRYKLVKFVFYYTIRIPGLSALLNKRTTLLVNKALTLNPKQLALLEEKSNESLKKFAQTEKIHSKQIDIQVT